MTEKELADKLHILHEHMKQAELWFLIDVDKRPENLAAEWMRLHKEIIEAIIRAL